MKEGRKHAQVPRLIIKGEACCLGTRNPLRLFFVRLVQHLYFE